MKARPKRFDEETKSFKPCSPEEATHVRIKLPQIAFVEERGFERIIDLPVQIRGTRKGTGNWTWNGDTEEPTFRPSLATDHGDGCKCHCWVNAGCAQFLDDSTHELAGKTIALLDV